MDIDALIAGAGLIGLAAVTLTGALWDSPVVTAAVRWLEPGERQPTRR